MSDSICLYCKSSDSKEWTSFQDVFGDTFHLKKCLKCGIFYLSPPPTSAQLVQAYDESYYGEGDKKFNSIVERVVEWFRCQNARIFSKKLPDRAKVLDIGCGNGSFLYNLGKQGDFELHGIEMPGKSAERAAELKVIKLHLDGLKENTYTNNYFDAIVLTHVFEHLPNPKETLEIIQNIAKPNALLQIEIPNIDSWQAQLFKGNWLHLDPPRHLCFFSPTRLKSELKKYGFDLVEEGYFSPQFSPFGVQQSILNFLLPKREILYEHLKGSKDYTKEYSSFHLFCQKLFHWFTFPIFVFTDFIASAFSKGGTVKVLFRKKDQVIDN